MPQVGITEYSTPNVLLLLYTVGFFFCVCVYICVYIEFLFVFIIFLQEKNINAPY